MKWTVIIFYLDTYQSAVHHVEAVSTQAAELQVLEAFDVGDVISVGVIAGHVEMHVSD